MGLQELDDALNSAPPMIPEILAPVPGRNTNKSAAVLDREVKHAAFFALIEQGASPARAAQALGYSRSNAYALCKGLDKKPNAYEAARDALLSDSVKTLKKFVKGQPIGGSYDPEKGRHVNQIIPKCSTVMRAVEMVMDREAPKVTLTASITADFTPIQDDFYA